MRYHQSTLRHWNMDFLFPLECVIFSDTSSGIIRQKYAQHTFHLLCPGLRGLL